MSILIHDNTFYSQTSFAMPSVPPKGDVQGRSMGNGTFCAEDGRNFRLPILRYCSDLYRSSRFISKQERQRALTPVRALESDCGASYQHLSEYSHQSLGER